MVDLVVKIVEKPVKQIAVIFAKMIVEQHAVMFVQIVVKINVTILVNLQMHHYIAHK